MDATDDAFLIDVLDQHSPQGYAYTVAVWCLADLCDLLEQQRGIALGITTASRTLDRLGFRYGRLKHDPDHRQNMDPKENGWVTLTELQKRGWC